MSAIAQKLSSIIDISRIYTWEDLQETDGHLSKKQILTAISGDTTPSCIVYPQTQTELKQVIAFAHNNRWGILPCGNGSKLNWGGLVKDVNIIVSTQHLNRIIEHAVGDLTVTVEAGIKFADLQTVLNKVGQFLAIDPAYPQTATIGGIVATGDTGSLRQRYNSVRDMLLGISFIRADGEVAKAGGRVVKNVAGYDLMKLFTGSFGTLGIISEVTFRLYPQQEASATVVLTGASQGIAQASKNLLTSALTPVAVDLLSTELVSNLNIGAGMGLITRFQSVALSVKEQCDRLLAVGKHLGLSSSIYTNSDDVDLWQNLQNKLWEPTTITCKIGVLPNHAVTIIQEFEQIAPNSANGLIHAGKGLGVVSLTVEENKAIQVIEKMRQICQANGGFLSILQAPSSIKQKIDVWGYTGNAVDLMQKIKHQFDPHNILSYHRFVDGI